MSQHDMDIANQAGAAFRADLNLALGALVSNNSGSAAPTTTFAYMFWADTNTGLLKQRNGANTAWVTIGLLGVANFGHVLPGTVIFHAKNTAPAGYLKANGGAVSRTTYADLFAEIGTTFGTGDGSTTFNLPELRAEFIRGWDDSRGVDSGRTFGSAQAQQLEQHTHTLLMSSGAGGAFVIAASGSQSSIQNPGYVGNANSGSYGTETRPRNVALLACIKY